MIEAMSDIGDRPRDAPADPPGHIDVDRIKKLTAIGDAKSLDPSVPVYDPLDHLPIRPDDVVGARSSEHVGQSDAESLVDRIDETVPVRRPPSTAGVSGQADREPEPVESSLSEAENSLPDAPARGLEDDFGEVDVERLLRVPCGELRPQRVYELTRCETPLTEADSDAIERARNKIQEVLDDAPGPELTADDVREGLQYINPTGGRLNCVECAKSVDDLLRGHASAAGPTEDQEEYYVQAALSIRSFDYVEGLTSSDVERQLLDAGPGARGIVIGWANHGASHAYNVANIGGELYWLDGQNDLMTEHDPHSFKSFDLFRTG